MNQGDIKKVVKSGDENKLIQLLTSMNNRIILLEKQKVNNKDFNDYKRKKKGWFRDFLHPLRQPCPSASGIRVSAIRIHSLLHPVRIRDRVGVDSIDAEPFELPFPSVLPCC